MTTLLGVYQGRRCVGTCDARCYNARKPAICGCICWGKNHGVGLTQAEANVRDGVGRRRGDLERFAQRQELQCEELVVLDRSAVPGLYRAASLAEHELYMRKHQLQLPFEEKLPYHGD